MNPLMKAKRQTPTIRTARIALDSVSVVVRRHLIQMMRHEKCGADVEGAN